MWSSHFMYWEGYIEVLGELRSECWYCILCSIPGTESIFCIPEVDFEEDSEAEEHCSTVNLSGINF